jgi:hypothetical protein
MLNQLGYYETMTYFAHVWKEDTLSWKKNLSTQNEETYCEQELLHAYSKSDA